MKTKLHFKVLLIVLIPVLYFVITAGFKEKESIISKAVSIVDNSFTKNFINLIFTDTYFGRTNPNDPRAIENNINNFRDSLHFNSIHVYGHDNSGGGLDENISTYQTYVNILMRRVNDSGLRGFYGRETIERISYGQRLEYESEGGNNGFSYSNNTGSVISDSGRVVVHGCLNVSECPEADATPRYLCQSIYENLQHGDLINFHQADTTKWFLRPVMRIDSSIVDANPEDSVVRIDVINYKGNIIKSIKIKARNFGKFDGISLSYLYNGDYIQSFDFSNDPQIDMEISGSRELPSGLSYGMNDNFPEWKDSCKVDFKIWWYGEVEVWFDKIVVDDFWGNQMFTSDTSIRLPRERKIKQEALAFTDVMGDGTFFIDELCMSEIPNVKRVYEIMKEAKPNIKLNYAVTNYFNTRSMKNNSIGNRELLKIQSESFNVDAHELHDTKIPPQLNSSNILIPDRWKSQSVNEYTESLQKRAFGDKTSITINEREPVNIFNNKPNWWGSLVYQIELARNQRDSISPFTKFIMQPQIQGVLRVEDGYFDGAREPTNEEIETQAMLSIAHGADGICWFTYTSSPTNFYRDISSEYSILGLQNNDPPNYTHRHSNIYGQDKWKAVREMNIKIEHWKPTLDKIDWQSGWSVHKEGASHDFISDIKSIYRDPSTPFTFTSANEDATKYWEMGFFDPDFSNTSADQNDKSKYFMMVNRRCVPESYEGIGDIRLLKIKFDSSQLTGFVNWKMIDLNTNNTVATFNKNTTSYINMGEFLPGEGKLYKLAPVMQEGGMLVADEEVIGNFECNGEVNNNGKNITLKPSTTINFTNANARIKMNGGDFKSGINTGDNTSPVNLKGKDGMLWKGIVLTDCPNVVMYNTFFDNISPYELDSTYALDLVNCAFIHIDGCSFHSQLDINSGGVRANFVSNEDTPVEAYIFNSTFEMDAGNIPALSFISSGSLTIPLIIENNNFTSLNGNSSNAIFLSNMSGGAVKDNNITGYKNGVFMMSSSMDFYNNLIDGSSDNSIGIQGYSQSNISIGTSGNYYTAGQNVISSEGANSKCVFVDKSFFDIHKGENIFDIKNYNSNQSFHLSGWFPTHASNEPISAVYNCFKTSGNNVNAIQNVKWVNGIPVNFTFNSYSC